jgi:HD-like signal output (HDOD) protein
VNLYLLPSDPDDRGDRARQILRRAHADSPSPSLLRIEEHIRRGDHTARQLAGLIEGSPALAARVLRMANSAFYAPIEPVVSLNRAVAMLGETVIRQLVLTSLVLSRRAGSCSPRQTLAAACVMGDAVRVATVSRAIADMTNLVPRDEAFAGGLLHDLGHIYLLDEVGEDYAIYLLATTAPDDELLREIVLAGATHQDLGAAFAYDWNLPDAVATVLHEHHSPEPRTMAAIVHAADTIVRETSRATLDDETAEDGIDPVATALEWVGLDRARWAVRGATIREEYASLLTLFDTIAA